MGGKAAHSLYLGLMSGTSMDGVDAAVVSFEKGVCRVQGTHKKPYSPALRASLQDAVRRPDSFGLDLLGELDHELALCFAEAAMDALRAAGTDASRIVAIGSHGQTVRHRPDLARPFTLQIGDPNIIAARTGITTVADFRRRDMALGGQGAPLAPAFHQWLFAGQATAVVNIGGISNLTVVRDDRNDTTGFDTGPGNTLLDAWTDLHRSLPFDDRGLWAASGKVSRPLLSALLDDPYFRQPPPKSTGFEYFNLDWLRTRAALDDFDTADVQATIAELTAASIADAVRQSAASCERVLVCGGGTHNDHLMSRLAERLPGLSVAPTSVAGIDPDWVEAAAFAWLAMRTLEGQFGNLPGVTGASSEAVLGGVYFGSS